MRIGPYGVLRVRERFKDLIERYPQEAHQMESYQRYCLKFEGQLQAISKISLQNINDHMIQPEIEKLKAWEVVSDDIA